MNPRNGTAITVKQEFIRDFGDAYLRFGLPKLMGNIIGLLLYEEGLLSLDQITEKLGVSKGPVSQVMTRLRDHNLVVRETIPGDRKDFYRAADDIFGQAFENHAALFYRNLSLARSFRSRCDADTIPDSFTNRVEEMTLFYSMMTEHFEQFLTEWAKKREELFTSQEEELPTIEEG